MNKNKLKTYAPQARRDFRRIVAERAALLGLSPTTQATVTRSGEAVIINGREFPVRYADLREVLARRIEREGYEQFIEEIAYTWFNRFTALRYLELHAGYLPHGLRVLSHPTDKAEPELLEQAHTVELRGLARETVVELKLAGNREAELYRLLLIAQCNQLHESMPFLFERINDETEILLPDNLLHSDSVIRKLVSQIDEADWHEVEIIGWLYQFYISERKDEVIGKTVKTEDIPAATQLFTPNWIVKYMTQNSLGRLWCEANPHSQLAQNMAYYIAPTEENQSAIRNPQSASEASHNPEELRILDPACGSGHILVEAYDLLKEIYLERGYRLRDIPQLILSRNLYGLDIDPRAVQLASFALLMKARADDRRIFDAMRNTTAMHSRDAMPRVSTGNVNGGTGDVNDGTGNVNGGTVPHICVIPDSTGLEAGHLAEMLFSEGATGAPEPILANRYLSDEFEAQPSLLMETTPAPRRRPVSTASGSDPRQVSTQSGSDGHQVILSEQTIIALLELFAAGKTLGSLLRIPAQFGALLAELNALLAEKAASADWMAQQTARTLQPFVRAAQLLGQTYDCVIANPPYMGSKGMNAELKAHAARAFPDSKSDLFAMFIERNLELTKEGGQLGFMSPFVWMFISSYEKLRNKIIANNFITSLVQLEYSGFDGATVPICTFTLAKTHQPNAVGSFVRLSDFRGAQNQGPKTLEAIQNPACGWFYRAKPDDFKKIPGSPIAYWVSDDVRNLFGKNTLRDFTISEGAVKTGNNEKYLRQIWEVSGDKIGPQNKWRKHPKGGDFRKWFGNVDWVVDWSDSARKHYREDFIARILPETFWNLAGIGWTAISSEVCSFRIIEEDEVANNAALTIFPIKPDFLPIYLGYLNTNVATHLLRIVSPTLNFLVGDIQTLPFLIELESLSSEIMPCVNECLSMARADWDAFETSWDFQTLPLLRNDECGVMSDEKDRSASSGNPSFSSLITPHSSLSVAAAWREWESLCHERITRMQALETENNRLFIAAYGLQDELAPEVPLAQITLARADAAKDMRRLVSYAVGCRLGRYALDAPGLIYAGGGNLGFDPSRYATFPASPDGLLPVTDLEWFPDDDAAHWCAEFLRVAFGEQAAGGGEQAASSRQQAADSRQSDAASGQQAAGSRQSDAASGQPAADSQQSDAASGQPAADSRQSDASRLLPANNASLPAASRLLPANLAWLAEQLGAKSGELPLETIRRYFSQAFFKDHTQTYKKRPIYWLFSSGKHKAFECLVYLHRYHAGTLARMRTNYVIPLLGKMAARLEMLTADRDAATNGAAKNRLQKQIDLLRRKQDELNHFDDNLRHYADQRITLDLDDGVKVNYAKFGNLLADVKTIAASAE